MLLDVDLFSVWLLLTLLGGVSVDTLSVFPSILMPLSDEVIFGVSGLWITSVPLAALLPFSVAEISAPLIASLPLDILLVSVAFITSVALFTAEVPSDISVILVPSATLLIALAPSATFPTFKKAAAIVAISSPPLVTISTLSLSLFFHLFSNFSFSSSISLPNARYLALASSLTPSIQLFPNLQFSASISPSMVFLLAFRATF